jgi:two-component system NarL family sensor kinase
MSASAPALVRVAPPARERVDGAPVAGAAFLAAGLALIAAATVVLVLVEHADVPAQGRPELGRSLVRIVSGTVMLPLAALLVARLPRHPIAWILAAATAGELVAAAASQYAVYSHFVEPLPLGVWAGWVSEWASSPIVLVPAVALLLFPAGTLPSPRWRPALWCGLAAAGFATLRGMLGPPDDLEFQGNPLVGDSSLLDVGDAFSVGWFLMVVASVAGIVALVRRRRAPGLDDDTREQLRLMARVGAVVVVAFAACVVGALAAPTAFDVGAIAAVGSLAALAVTMAVAILRYRLYGVDVFVDRALVLTVVTVLLGALYVGAVVVASRLLGVDVELGVALPATVLVAVAFHPLRERVQRSVARLLHGHRDEPYAAVTTLGRRLGGAMSPDRVLPVTVETIADALRLPYVAVELAGADGPVVTAHGTPDAGIALRLPLEHAGQRVGTLVVGARDHHEELGAADRRLLEVFAERASAAVSAVGLSVEVQRAREQLVTAREEERRRLRSDLHDGLGPKLAGAVLTIDAARRLIKTDPEAADALLDGAAANVEGTVDGVRRVVYALRPPALDQLGLLGALRQQAGALSTAGGGLTCDVEAPRELSPLPAAVEVAAFRIAQEALTNVTRHAAASRATISVAVDGDLHLEISDDGRGLPPDAPVGVGLTSMRDRAAELGGTFAIERPPAGGTRVRVRLPLAAP